jgi:hypothetical protein
MSDDELLTGPPRSDRGFFPSPQSTAKGPTVMVTTEQTP